MSPIANPQLALDKHNVSFAGIKGDRLLGNTKMIVTRDSNIDLLPAETIHETSQYALAHLQLGLKPVIES